MASLIERSPCEGLLPVAVEGAGLSEVSVGPISSIAPLKGKDRAVSAAMKAVGVGFPGVGKALAEGGATCVWTGRGQAFLLGAAVPEGLAGIAAVTDQSDGWAVMRLQGAKAEAVLARLVPLDLRASVFKKGQAARSSLGHMALVLHRSGATAFDLMVFRSMAATAVHELHQAMRAVAARG